MGTPNYAPQTTINLSQGRGPDKDLTKIHKAIANRKPVMESDYLENTRRIARETFTNPLFKDRVLKGFNGFILFPHHNENGLVGYEYRGEGGKGFARVAVSLRLGGKERTRFRKPRLVGQGSVGH